ncbi:MAG: iron-containing alcohol dehydrogenase [Oscillospiraceae bacterium]
MDTFSCPTRIFFGGGGLDALDALKGERVFVVTDGFLAGSGLLETVVSHFGGGAVEIFSEVVPDPGLELVAKGVAAWQAFRPTAAVAFGGGSPIDCCKAIRYFAKDGVPLYVVPTTAGTGSEVTSFAVLTDSGKGVKCPVVDRGMLPDVAILEPSFLKGVPPNVTADTGMDVLTHAAEAYVSKNATPFSDALARDAFARGYRNLAGAYGGNEDAKGEMLFASCLAGLAFNAAGLGICHALSHTLGGSLHLPHGTLNAILLPHVIRYNGSLAETAKKYGELAGACGLTATARALSFGVARLGAAIGEPARLEEKIDRAATARQALLDPCAGTNPRTATEGDLGALLRQAGER